MSKDNEHALMVVIPKQGPNAESTNDLVHDLRDYHKDAQDKYIWVQNRDPTEKCH